MRWPFRRGDRGRDAHGAPTVPPSALPATQPDRGWAALAPITPTWSRRSPLTSGAEPIRPATLQPRAIPPSRSVPAGAPEPGRVIGLAAVIAPLPAPVEAPAPLPEYFHRQPPLRHATARPIVEHAPLTQASPEWVGEPVAAAAPPPPPPPQQSLFPGPQPVRPDPQVEAMTEAGARFREALANLHKRGAPDYVPGQGDDMAPPPPPPPPATQAPAPAADQPPRPAPGSQRPMTYRRNSLAESRRLGLGAPLREGQDGDEQPLTHPPAARPAEPAPAATAQPPATPPTATPPPEPPAGPVAQQPPSAPTPPPAATPPPEPPARPVAQQPPPGPAIPPATAPAPRHAAADDSTGDAGRDGPDGGGGEARGRTPIRPVPTVRPMASGATRPTASVAPLVFRAAVRPVDAPPPEQKIVRVPERAVVTRAPAELAQALRTSHGVDVADVPVRRDPDAGSEARQRKARAFTRGATVYLPDDADPATSPAARGLLAHELVHAAQQRRLGGALPAEDSVEGRALEAEAVAAERLYSNVVDLAPETLLVHAPPPVTADWVEDRIVQHAPVEAPPQLPPTLEPMRQDIERVADHSARQVVAEWTNPAFGGPHTGGPHTGASPLGPTHPGTSPLAPPHPTAPHPVAPIPGAPIHIPGLNPPAPAGFGPPPDYLASRLPLARGNTRGTSSVLNQSGPLNEADREQRYLDIVNAEHIRRNEPEQLDLTDSDINRMDDLFSDEDTARMGMGGLGAQSNEPPRTEGLTWRPGVGLVAAGSVEEDTSGMFGGNADLQGIAGFMSLFHNRDAADDAAEAADPNAPHRLSLSDAIRTNAAQQHYTPPEPAAPTTAVTGSGTTGTGATAGAASATAAAQAVAAQRASAQTQPADAPVDIDRLDMEELSTRIYSRLRSRLRQELLVDRERAGLLTDYR